MIRKLTIIIMALGLALAACGDDETDVATPGDNAPMAGDEQDPGVGGEDALPAPVCIHENEDLLPDYRGITPDQAQEMADDQGLELREVGRDGECFAITMDLRDDRVNIEVVGDMVVAAYIG